MFGEDGAWQRTWRRGGMRAGLGGNVCGGQGLAVPLAPWRHVGGECWWRTGPDRALGTACCFCAMCRPRKASCDKCDTCDQ